jgi:hypothetical protein
MPFSKMFPVLRSLNLLTNVVEIPGKVLEFYSSPKDGNPDSLE